MDNYAGKILSDRLRIVLGEKPQHFEFKGVYETLTKEERRELHRIKNERIKRKEKYEQNS